MKYSFLNELKGTVINVIHNHLFIDENIIFRLLKEKEITVNNIKIKENLELLGNELITIFLPEKFLPYIKIIYEDINITVVDKPAGVAYEFLAKVLEIKLNKNIFPVHRLDRQTSGVLIFANNVNIKNAFIEAFKNNKIKKIYFAKVYGQLSTSKGKLHNYLFKDVKKAKVYVSDIPKKGYQESILYYKNLGVKNNYTEVEIDLITGRTHQIRAQFAHIGHFVLGDGKYGINKINTKMKVSSLQLRAKSIKILELQGYNYLENKIFSC